MTEGLRASDGSTIPQLLDAMKTRIGKLSDESVSAIGVEARKIVADEGQAFFIRARRTRKPVRLGAKLSKSTANRPVIDGSPAGFWAIVEKGSKKHRIERRLIGRGNNRRAQLLRTPYGPRPYVLHPGHRPLGRPWEKAMDRVGKIPSRVLDPLVTAAFRDMWKG